MSDDNDDAEAKLWSAARQGLARTAGECPDASDLAGFAEGRLISNRAIIVEAHAAGCPVCSAILANAALAAPLQHQPAVPLQAIADGRRQVFRWAGVAAACVCMAVTGAWTGSATARSQQSIGKAAAAQLPLPGDTVLAGKGDAE